MDNVGMTGDIEPCHSFLMAAKYDFMSRSIKTGSLSYLSPPGSQHNLRCMKDDISRSHKFQSQMCTISVDVYNTDEDMRITADKPHKCDLCPKSFHKKQYLKIHRSAHIVRLYTCGTCHKQFRRPNCLKEHKRVHTGVKPYECGTCCQQFTRQRGLKQHEKIHTGVKPYECETCHRRFIRPSDMKRHVQIHKGTKINKCDKCNKEFTYHSDLKSHIIINTDCQEIKDT